MNKKIFSIALALIAGLLVQAGLAKPKATIVTIAYQAGTTKIQGVADQIKVNIDNALNQIGTVVFVDRSVYDAEIVKNGQKPEAAQSDFPGVLAGKITAAQYVCYIDVMDAVVTRIYKDKVWDEKDRNGNVYRRTKKIWFWEGRLSLNLKIYDTKTGIMVYSYNQNYAKPYEEDWSPPALDPMTGMPVLPDFNTLRPDLVTGSVVGVVNDLLWTDLYNVFRPSGKVVDIKPEDEKGKTFIVTIDIGQDVGVKDWEKYQVLILDPATLPPITPPQKSQVAGVVKIKTVLGNQAQGVANKKDAAMIKAGMDVKAKVRPYGGVTGVNALFY